MMKMISVRLNFMLTLNDFMHLYDNTNDVCLLRMVLFTAHISYFGQNTLHHSAEGSEEIFSLKIWGII